MGSVHFDFDSTRVGCESLEELGAAAAGALCIAARRRVHGARGRGSAEGLREGLGAQAASHEADSMQARGEIGYVVIDVDSIGAGEALPLLRSVKGTLRTRILD